MRNLEQLAPGLDAGATARLREVAGQVRVRPERVATVFPAVARKVSRGPADPSDELGLVTPRLEDQARVALLVELDRGLAGDRERLVTEVSALYRYGDADEKRGVLRALDELELAGEAVSLVADALRSNDSRLVAAALGRYAARRLDAPAWRDGVLKCVFLGIPLDAVAGLADRADGELARMAADFAAERQAAGRPVPTDAARLVEMVPQHVREG